MYFKKEVIVMFLCQNFHLAKKLLKAKKYFAMLSYSQENSDYFLVVESKNEYELLEFAFSVSENSIYDSLKMYSIINSLEKIDFKEKITIDNSFSKKLLFLNDKWLVGEDELSGLDSSKKSRRKICISHASNMNYEQNIYQPIKDSILYQKYEICFSHELKLKEFRKILSQSDILLAEVSCVSSRLGIEIGWALENGVKTITLGKKDLKIENIYQEIGIDIILYQNADDMMQKINSIIENL